jgi:hypothetical protein
MLPLVAAVTLAIKALCLAANSGLLKREERLARPSLKSDRGDSEPGAVDTAVVVAALGGAAGAAALRAARRLRLAAAAEGSFGSIAMKNFV